MPSKRKHMKGGIKKDKLYIFPNPDKKFQETWHPGRGMLNTVHSSRMIVCGSSGRGKTQKILNFIMHQDPPFKRVYVCHYDGAYTREYDCLKAEEDIKAVESSDEEEDEGEDGKEQTDDETDMDRIRSDRNLVMLDKIPDPKTLPGKEKSLMIFDDCSYSNMDKKQKSNLSRIFGYGSSHKNMSVILSSQVFSEVPVDVRRMADVFVLHKTHDLINLQIIGPRLGITGPEFLKFFKKHVRDYYDSITLDFTKDTPYPLRRNMVEMIKLHDEEE